MVSDTPFTWMMVHVITHLPSPSNASSPHREHERNGTHAVEMGDIEKCLKTDGRTIYRDTANVLRLSVKTNLTKIMKLSYSRLIAVASETCYSYLFALSRTESSFFLGYRISKWKEKKQALSTKTKIKVVGLPTCCVTNGFHRLQCAAIQAGTADTCKTATADRSRSLVT